MTSCKVATSAARAWAAFDDSQQLWKRCNVCTSNACRRPGPGQAGRKQCRQPGCSRSEERSLSSATNSTFTSDLMAAMQKQAAAVRSSSVAAPGRSRRSVSVTARAGESHRCLEPARIARLHCRLLAAAPPPLPPPPPMASSAHPPILLAQQSNSGPASISIRWDVAG